MASLYDIGFNPRNMYIDENGQIRLKDPQKARAELDAIDAENYRNADFSGYEMSTFPASDIFNKLDAEAMSGAGAIEVPIRQGILDPSIFNYQRSVQEGLTDPTPTFQIDNRFINTDTVPDLTYDYDREDQKGFGDPIEEEEEKFNIIDFLPFGDKSVVGGIINMLPERSQVARGLDEMYRDRNTAGTISSGLMQGYNPISGGALNFFTGGRYGNPTTYGLQRAYQNRIDTINKTEARKKAKGLELSDELKQRRDDLAAAKAEELQMLQAAQKRDDDIREADAYATQLGDRYTGGENTRSARTTGNYDDPFAPGYAD